MTNKNRTTFYTGVTNDLRKRVAEHVNKTGSKFVTKYNLFDLIYFEHFTDINYAIKREKQIKNWHKEWKMNLIKKTNPKLQDLKNTF